MTASGAARDTIERAYKESAQKAQNMVSDLQKKYGKEKVRNLVYSTDKNGKKVINERVVTGSDIALSALSVVGAMTVGILTPTPIVFYQVPRSRKDRGASIANDAFLNEWGALKKQQKLARKAQSNP